MSYFLKTEKDRKGHFRTSYLVVLRAAETNTRVNDHNGYKKIREERDLVIAIIDYANSKHSDNTNTSTASPHHHQRNMWNKTAEDNSTEGLQNETKNNASSSSAEQELGSYDYTSLGPVDSEAVVGSVCYHERSPKAVQLEIVVAGLLLIAFDQFQLSSAFQYERPQFSVPVRRNGGCCSIGTGKVTITHLGHHRQKQDFFCSLFGTQTDESETDLNSKTLSNDDSSLQQQQRLSFGWSDFKRLIYDGVDSGIAASLIQDDVLQKESYYEKSKGANLNDDIRKGYVQNSYISGVADPERPKKASTRITNDVLRTDASTWSPATASSPVRPEPVVSLQKQNRQNDSPRSLLLRRQAAEVSTEKSSTVDGEAAASRPSSKWKSRGRDKSTNTIAMSSLEIISKPSINRRLSRLDQHNSMFDQQLPPKQTKENMISSIDKERTNDNRRRLQNDMKIREEEAKKRALIRNEVYVDRPTMELLDSSESDQKTDEISGMLIETIVSGIEGLPGAVEKTVTNTIVVAKSIPGTMQSIPKKIVEQARATKNLIESGADATQKVAKDIQDIPIKVSKSVEDAQQSLHEAQESITQM